MLDHDYLLIIWKYLIFHNTYVINASIYNSVLHKMYISIDFPVLFLSVTAAAVQDTLHSHKRNGC